MDEHWHGSKITARFEPKRRETLRACMEPLIGTTFVWEWAGVGDSDEPYPGQNRWTIDRQHDHEVPAECRGRWAPDEDLVLV